MNPDLLPEKALEALLASAYADLRRLAGALASGEREGHTLQPTALVHEAYLRLRGGDARVRDRAHFFALASSAIRRTLVDHARARAARKRGGDGGARRVPLAGVAREAADERGAEERLDLDEALARLRAEDPEKARVVELRFFAGLSTEETAALLGVTTRAVERRFAYARAFLYRELGGGRS